MGDILTDLAKRGYKILLDTKAPRQTTVKTKALPAPTVKESDDLHSVAVRRFVKEKPAKKHLLEFFQQVIEMEEKKL